MSLFYNIALVLQNQLGRRFRRTATFVFVVSVARFRIADTGQGPEEYLGDWRYVDLPLRERRGVAAIL